MLTLAFFTVGLICSVYGGPVLYSGSIPVHVPVGAAAVAPAGAAVVQPFPLLQTIRSQFHSQDELGQYSYGYSNEHSSKVETKGFNGLTSGGYSYIDANGLVQNVNYISDDENGFRVAASNLPIAPAPGPAVVAAPAPILPVAHYPLHVPQVPEPVSDTPEVQAAKEQHLAAKQEAEKAAAAAEAAAASNNEEASTDEPAESTAETPEEGSESETKTSDVKDAPVTSPATPVESPKAPEQPESPKTQEAPLPSSAAAEAASAEVLGTILRAAAHPSYLPAVLPGSYAAYPSLAYNPYSPFQAQYHTQDDFGQYAYGYAGGPSSKEEVKTLDGITRGGYNYIDANGVVQSVKYVADPELGFNVVATNLPRPVKPEPSASA